MVSSLGGWHLFGLLIYVVMIAIAVVLAYFVIRLAVFHALKAHTRWVDNGKP
ncbi:MULTISPECIES: hypothetical protein [Bacteria]